MENNKLEKTIKKQIIKGITRTGKTLLVCAGIYAGVEGYMALVTLTDVKDRTQKSRNELYISMEKIPWYVKIGLLGPYIVTKAYNPEEINKNEN